MFLCHALSDRYAGPCGLEILNLPPIKTGAQGSIPCAPVQLMNETAFDLIFIALLLIQQRVMRR